MTNNDQLLPREKLLRDTFTPAETALFISLLIVCLAAFWIGVPRSNWLLGLLTILGCLTPMLLKQHEHTHPFFIDHLWRRFFWLISPACILAALHLLGLLQNPLVTFIADDSRWVTLREVNRWLPVSAAGGKASLSVTGHIAVLLLAVPVFLIPKSRTFFERLMPWLCLFAVGIAIFGYMQDAFALESTLFSSGTGRSDFFAVFPYDGHWAAFATLWSCACFAMALLTTRYDDSPPFIATVGPFYLVGGLILGASALLVEAPRPAGVLLLTTALMLLIVAFDFAGSGRDPHRRIIALLSGLGSILFFIIAFSRMLSPGARPPYWDELQDCAWRLFKERPLFGSGMDSFIQLLPFYGSDRLEGLPYARAGSDLAHLLAEFGLVGLLACSLPILLLTLRYALRGRRDIRLTNHLLIGLAAILFLALVDTPFMSPTVLMSFLILLFTAFRWADLTRSRVDEVDTARIGLVAAPGSRKVPVYKAPNTEITRS